MATPRLPDLLAVMPPSSVMLNQSRGANRAVENTWLSWAKQLQAIASTGVHFTDEKFDEERYLAVADIANQMLATLADVPVGRIEDLTVDFAAGYVTPRVDVRGAVFSAQGILLVREASDGLWTLPGGYADVGLSPRENVEKEVWEEAALRVTARQLYCVRHKAKHDYNSDIRDFYKMFFICEQIGSQTPKAGVETTDVGFFGPDELPPLSTGRVLAADIALAFATRDSADERATFD